MRVFNLINKPLDFRGKTIPGNGGSEEFPELDTFISDRDKLLAQTGTISIGQLPPKWRAQRERAAVLSQATRPTQVARLALKEMPTAPEDRISVTPVEKRKGR